MPSQRQTSRTYSSLLLASALLFQAATLSAQITIAVLDFDGFGISQTEAIALSNRLRNELFRLGTFEVVDRGMMENILAEQDFQRLGCTSNECLVEVGRLLGAQQMVGGSISKVGQTFSVSARLVDVETGKLLSVSDFDQRGEIDDMLTRGMREVAVQLARRIPTDGDSSSSQPALGEDPSLEENESVSGGGMDTGLDMGDPNITTTQGGSTVDGILEVNEPSVPSFSQPSAASMLQARTGWGDNYGMLALSSELPVEYSDMKAKIIFEGGLLFRNRGTNSNYAREDLVYGIILYRWDWRDDHFTTSLFSGLGFGFDLDGENRYAIVMAGAQAKIKIPLLPDPTADVRLVFTPRVGISIMPTYGVDGNLLQIAMTVLGLIIIFD